MSLILDGTSGLFGNVTGGDISGNFIGLNGDGSSLTATATGSTTARSLENRFADVVNVLDFGADPTGVIDSSNAFENAAIFAPFVYVEQNGITGFPLPKTCQVDIPNGIYKITRELQIPDKQVIWNFSQGSIIQNGFNNYLGGVINRSGSRINSLTKGVRDDACGMSVYVNDQNSEAAIMGFVTPAQLASYQSRDACALFSYAEPNDIFIDSSSTSFTQNSVTFSSSIASVSGKLQKGIIIDILDTSSGGTKVSGFITDWNVSLNTIYVDCWYCVNGGVAALSLVTGSKYTILQSGTVNWTSIGASSNAVGTVFVKNSTIATGTGLASLMVTPLNGSRTLVNNCTSVWSQNSIVRLSSSDTANTAIGYEINLLNNKANPAGAGAEPIFWGAHCVPIGQYKVDTGFVSDASTQGMFRGFLALKTDIAFCNRSDGAILQSLTNSGIQNFVISSTGDIELGYVNNGSTGSRYIDFHTSGTNTDYDVRLLATQGGGVGIGQGTLAIKAKDFITETHYPGTHNSYDLGLGGATPTAWRNIYSQNPVTVVSDIRQKKDIEESVLGLDFINKLKPVSYKFIEGSKKVVDRYYINKDGNKISSHNLPEDSTEKIITESIQGERRHFGLLAQEVKAALPDGVDFGGWVLLDKENPDSPQALRYDQFIAPLIKAVQEISQENALLKQRIEALESK
jgi:hypothetical protein